MARSEAEKLAEAQEDIERIAREFWDFDRPEGMPGWEELVRAKPITVGQIRGAVRSLLERDIIRVGRRPATGPAPMEGQTTVDEMICAADEETLRCAQCADDEIAVHLAMHAEGRCPRQGDDAAGEYERRVLASRERL